MNEDKIAQCKADIAKLQENLKKLEEQNKNVQLAISNKNEVCLRVTTELLNYFNLNEGCFVFLGEAGGKVRFQMAGKTYDLKFNEPNNDWKILA